MNPDATTTQEAQNIAESPVPQQEAVAVQADTVPMMASSTEESQPVVYHTISGGPETLSETIAQQKKQELANPQGATSSLDSMQTPAVPQGDSATGGSGLAIFFLLVLLLIGGGVGYVYFMMPEIFAATLASLMSFVNTFLKQ